MIVRLSMLLFFLFTQATYAQHNFSRYSLQEGLPQSQVYAIAEDTDGYLWVGTQGGGLTRFNGISFESNLTIPDNYINALATDEQKRLWIGTNTALFVQSKDSIQTIPWPNSNQQKVTALKVYQGILWVGTEQGLFSLDMQHTPYQLIKKTKLKKAFIRSFYFDEDHQWVATNTGAWDLKSTIHFSIKNGLESNDVHAIIHDILGRLWVATFDGRITLFDLPSNTPLGALTIPNQGHPQFIAQVDQAIWIGTSNNGIASYSIDTKKWSLINHKNGLIAKNNKTIFRDSWNNLWIGTSGDGLLKNIGQDFVHIGIQAGLRGDNIYALLQDSKHRFIFSESSYGFAILDKGHISHFGQDEGFADVKCKAFLEDDENRLWIGTEGKGLAYQDTSGFHFLTKKDGLPSNWINSLALDTLGQIWAGTYGNGLVKIINKDSLGFQIFPYGKAEGLPDMHIQTIRSDPEHHLWFGTKYGKIGYYTQDFETIIFDKSNGLPQVAIRSLTFGPNGLVWVGTAGKGVYVGDWNKGTVQFHQIKMTHPKSSKNIYLVGFDKEGDLWVGTETGVDQIQINHRQEVIDFKHFGMAEGFIGIETCQNSFVRDNQDNLWFGTMNGLIKYQDNHKSKTIGAPKIQFRDIQLFYKSIHETDFKHWLNPSGYFLKGLVFPHDQNHLGFRLSATNLARPKQIKYRWQLAGSETDWSPLSQSPTINYANLSPGQYVFKAQACITADNCSPIITTSFGIEQPYWQTWWFRLGVASSLLFFIFVLYKVRINAIRKTELAKRKELELKNHLLTVEQKALQLQMNPHFIFNALNSINGLVALKDFAQARKQINSFAILMRQILSNSCKDSISLLEVKETLQNYIEMEQFCRPNTFQFNFQFSDKIDLEEIEIPPMIIQPFVENAIIHGVTHLEGDGLIQIQFAPKGEILICKITDNGVGRKKSAELQKSRNPSHQSTAMAVTKERLSALLAGHKRDALVISDVLDEQGAIKGTQVVLCIPIK